MRDTNEGPLAGSIKRWALTLGPLLAVLVWWTLPGTLDAGARTVAAVGVLMALWWLTEALPLPATALLPLALFPLLGAAPIKAAAAPYASDVIFLFMGGFMLGLAMERWNLHRRIALRLVLLVGTGPGRLVAGFLLSSALLSMWISNTATAVILMPVAVSVVGLVMRDAADAAVRNFATCLVLSVAYGASVGGSSTLIGSPPNLVVASFARERLECDISMLEWMAFGVPAMLLMLPAIWLLLTQFAFPTGRGDFAGGGEPVRRAYRALGAMSRPEKAVLGVFGGAALAWIFRPQLAALGLPLLNDATIAMIAALLLFVLPAREGERLLDWEQAQKLPWGVLLLFGGGLSLAAALADHGVDAFIADAFSRIGTVPDGLLVGGAVALTVFGSELASNTAIATSFVPVLAAAASGLGAPLPPMLVAIALGASYAFMLPVGTPPNALAFASGHVTLRQMVCAGLVLNLLAIPLVTAVALLLGRGICA